MKSNKSLKAFFSNTSARFKGKVGIAFMATLISVFPFVAILFGAAWLSQLVHGLFAVLSVFALVCVGCAEVGHIRFIRMLANDEHPSLAVLFSGFREKNTLFYLFLGVVLFVIYLISGILLLVPLFFAIAAFSMVFYFVEHHKYDNILDALSVTSKRMMKHRWSMYTYKLVFYILYTLLFIAYVVALVFLLSIESLAVCVGAIVILHIIFFVVFSYITTLFSFSNYNFFMEELEYHERTSKKAVMPEVPVQEEEKKQEVTLEKVSIAEAPKKAPAKPRTTSATKSTTATKSTKTATTKSAPKKTTTKKVDKE